MIFVCKKQVNFFQISIEVIIKDSLNTYRKNCIFIEFNVLNIFIFEKMKKQQSLLTNQGQTPRLHALSKKFYRTSERCSSKSSKKQLSPLNKGQKLKNYYIPTSKILRVGGLSTDKQQTKINAFDSSSNTDRSKVQKLICNNQKQTTNEILIKRLVERNQQLELKLNAVTKTLNDHLNKQNKPMNKLRDKTQKERISELQSQNSLLKKEVQQLRIEIKEIKECKQIQSTLNEFINIQYEFSEPKIQDQLQFNQKQIFNLNETVKKLQLEMDFLNRRNHTEIVALKNNYEKEFKSIKDKFIQVIKTNAQLKKKNIQVINKLKNQRQKKCSCEKKRQKMRRSSSILSLSSD